ncbi:MAG: helix-turn-helix domain-containing protein [Chloroflexi bacterium]|nr:helix-turn-helix domain-containing protein [Chloroflexota bacterium]MYE38614.1 helix-turn-helix domain-containing protein [Chloroflexota bacterium]
MSYAPWERELLAVLAEMPFLDRLELAAVTGWSRGAVYRAVDRLEREGCLVSLAHATAVIARTRRYHLTAEGLRRLAKVEESGPPEQAVEELLRLHPVSRQWQRLLLERLDGVAVICRLAATVSNLDHPIGFRWYRADPLDAALTLPGGRTLGILREGHTTDRTGFAKRVWRLGQGPLPGVVLVLVPDEVRLRHARSLLARTPVAALLALERDAALAGPERRIWRPPSGNAALALGYALERLRPGGELPAEEPLLKAALPNDRETAVNALPVLLTPAEKRAMDLLADWPWLSRRELASLLHVSEPRVSQLAVSLEGHGLTARPEGAGGRLALSDRGLALLARRDRASVSAARKRWSVSPIDAARPMHWRNVSGGRSRQLFRNLDHTAAVHEFIAALAVQARYLGWGTAELDPPHRASRHFPHGGRLRAVHPDACGLLRRGSGTWAFLLEWERRAVRPATMTQRLAPYLRYYSTARPTDDHGVRPAVLVVFDDSIAAGHFLRLAGREMKRAGTQVPLLVSHRRDIEALGPLGRAWRVPGGQGRVGPLPAPPEGDDGEPGRRQLPVLWSVSHRREETVSQQHKSRPGGPRGRRGRAVVRLDAAALWERLAELDRSQNWLARETGVSHAYLSMLVNGGRAPSEGIQKRMLKALGLSQFNQLFRLEVTDEQT